MLISAPAFIEPGGYLQWDEHDPTAQIPESPHGVSIDSLKKLSLYSKTAKPVGFVSLPFPQPNPPLNLPFHSLTLEEILKMAARLASDPRRKGAHGPCDGPET